MNFQMFHCHLCLPTFLQSTRNSYENHSLGVLSMSTFFLNTLFKFIKAPILSTGSRSQNIEKLKLLQSNPKA